jgi:hypothetical protein
MSIQYFKCSGFKRVRTGKPNFLHAKGKALNASMRYESEFDNFKEKNVSYMYFIVSVNDLNSSLSFLFFMRLCDDESQVDLD